MKSAKKRDEQQQQKSLLTDRRLPASYSSLKDKRTISPWLNVNQLTKQEKKQAAVFKDEALEQT